MKLPDQFIQITSGRATGNKGLMDTIFALTEGGAVYEYVPIHYETFARPGGGVVELVPDQWVRLSDKRA